MPSAISPISSGLPVLSPGAALAPKAKGVFEQMLADSIRQVDQVQKSAAESVEQFLRGESEDVHRVAMDTQRAELALDLFLQVRNKVVQAYQEVMRMQV